ncbi:MAG: DegT/DnrJ/EryC1/StrS aminotransferase family protein, partial [Bacteroidales bacterium]|nr:DegT/DnrJ/EryC1/StrS aminotransferase family protein [Bacteroidales bacterium]
MEVPFSPPRIDDKVIAEVTDALKSGWITTGPKTKLFEQKLGKYIGNSNVLAVSSATAGLELVLKWFGLKEGDEVIVPAYTYCATANVVEHCGAKVVFCDVKSDDFNINPESVKDLITEKTKVIIPVDFGGFPADYKELYDIIHNEEIKGLFQADNDIQANFGRILLLADSA